MRVLVSGGGVRVLRSWPSGSRCRHRPGGDVMWLVQSQLSPLTMGATRVTRVLLPLNPSRGVRQHLQKAQAQVHTHPRPVMRPEPRTAPDPARPACPWPGSSRADGMAHSGDWPRVPSLAAHHRKARAPPCPGGHVAFTQTETLGRCLPGRAHHRPTSDTTPPAFQRPSGRCLSA